MNTETNLPEPYQGLRPYEEKDQDRFFGRDDDCKILIDKILANKLTLLFAASGVGKSSLLQASVLPRLKDPRHENLDAVYYNDWVTPPLTGLKVAVGKYLQQQGYIAADTPIEQPELKDFFGFCALFTRQPLILILDQFEEFFRYQRHQPDYQPFIQQLAAAVTDRSTPIALVLSMREDFALELNEFKPYLPTLLFENFYRLERLSQDNARLALISPLENVGFQFEDELLAALLKDLSTRELGQKATIPVYDLVDTVEPAYLQIICSQLWELDKTSPDKTLHYKTYDGKGKAKGLLENYVKTIVNKFKLAEQRLASQSFNHLVTQRGVKMAYTPEALAKAIDAKSAEPLSNVLAKLEQGRILRSQTRQDGQWYELYHDLFSASIEQWNDGFKSAERNRRMGKITLGVALASVVVFCTFDFLSNFLNHHLRLSIKPEVSDTVEVYQGKAESLDLFKQRDYQAETDYVRSQIEPDKLFANKPVLELDDLQTELIGTLPLVDRITAYWEDGQQDKALRLANYSISNDDAHRSQYMIQELALFRSNKAIQLLAQKLNLSALLNQEIVGALAFGNLGNPEALQPLIALLKDPESNVRRSAAEALAKLGKPEAVQPLIALLKDTSSDVRCSAAEALEKLGKPQAVQPLIALLKDHEPNVRNRAAKALGKLGKPEAVMPLIALLKDSDPFMRIWAMDALKALNKPEMVQPLIALLKDPEPGARSDAAVLLENLGTPEAVQPLIALLKDPEPGERSNAADLLGNLGTPEAVQPLIALLKDPEPHVRISAARALVKQGKHEAVQPLIALLKDPDRYLRRSASYLLGNLGKPEALQPLIALLKDPEPHVRSSAAETQRTLGKPEAVQPLIALLKNTERDVRCSAAEALEKLGKPEAVQPLIALLKDHEPNVRNSAAKALGKLGKPEAVTPLIALFKDPEPYVRVSAVYALQTLDKPEAVQPLIALFKDPDPYVRGSAADALKTLGKPELVQPLIALFKDPDPYVRVSAADTLRTLGKLEAVQPLIELLKDPELRVRNSAADALKILGKSETVQSLITLLKDPDLRVRHSAADTLKTLGKPEAVQPLITLLKSPAPDVRGSAADALKTLCQLEAIPALVNLRKHDSQSKEQISDVLQKLYDPITSLQYLKEESEKQTGAEKLQATPSIQSILVQVDDENINTQIKAILALGKINKPESITKLKTLLPNTNLRIQRAVLQSFYQLNQNELITALVWLIENTPNTISVHIYDLLGYFQVKQALPTLEKQLSELEQAYKNWRSIRDEVRDDFTDQQLEDWKKRLKAAEPKTYLNFQLGFTLARIDPESWGVKLLAHDLAKVREGAWMGLGRAGSVDLLQKLYQDWLRTDAPIFRHAAYRAMDHILIRLEIFGKPEEIAQLKQFQTQVENDKKVVAEQNKQRNPKPYDQRDSVATRVDWTISQWEWLVQPHLQAKAGH